MRLSSVTRCSSVRCCDAASARKKRAGAQLDEPRLRLGSTQNRSANTRSSIWIQCSVYACRMPGPVQPCSVMVGTSQLSHSSLLVRGSSSAALPSQLSSLLVSTWLSLGTALPSSTRSDCSAGSACLTLAGRRMVRSPPTFHASSWYFSTSMGQSVTAATSAGPLSSSASPPLSGCCRTSRQRYALPSPLSICSRGSMAYVSLPSLFLCSSNSFL
mmetsp:Transcript_1105/g.3094  ORF Transcript_1105/g.3094 Transcript_1105/m.3094 type:complete len:215 (-) Transcript_1105:141-785(-)